MPKYLAPAALPAAVLFALAGCASPSPGDAMATTDDTMATLDLTVATASPEGMVYVSLFADAESFDGGGQPVAVDRAPAGAVAVQFSFEGLEPGRYGVKAFHDIDGDGELNMNALGRPTEPYAFSNGAAGMFGPAKFADAAFEVRAPRTAHDMAFR